MLELKLRVPGIIAPDGAPAGVCGLVRVRATILLATTRTFRGTVSGTTAGSSPASQVWFRYPSMAAVASSARPGHAACSAVERSRPPRRFLMSDSSHRMALMADSYEVGERRMPVEGKSPLTKPDSVGIRLPPGLLRAFRQNVRDHRPVGVAQGDQTNGVGVDPQPDGVARLPDTGNDAGLLVRLQAVLGFVGLQGLAPVGRAESAADSLIRCGQQERLGGRQDPLLDLTLAVALVENGRAVVEVDRRDVPVDQHQIGRAHV